jgi:membrane protein implicated in regulation of membrane protease activity
MLFDFGFGLVSPRWIWAALVIIFTLIEIFTSELYTIWFAISALIMAFVSALNIPFHYQILIFLAISAALLFSTRPLVIKKFRSKIEKTNVDSLVGMHALVTKKIGEFNTGEVKLNGQFWTARSESDSEIQEGIKCEVVRIEGVQAIVRPLPASTENI